MSVIIEFRVKNHKSYREEQVLNLVASNYDKTLPGNLIKPKLPRLKGTDILKAAAVYGPNAGGKTNLLHALKFLKWLVVDSATGQRPEAKLPVEPFRLQPSGDPEPTLLEITFVASRVRYELAVALDHQRIIQERLVAYPKGRAQLWYDRVWNGERGVYEWSPEKASEFKRDAGVVAKTRENALFISTAAQWNNAQIAPLYHWFTDKLRFLNLGSETAQLSHDFTSRMVSHSSEMKRLVTDALRSADLGLVDFEANEERPGEEMRNRYGIMRGVLHEAAVPASLFPESYWQVTFQHEGRNGGRFPIQWQEESAGTRRLFSLLGPWLSLLVSGQVLCVDELDTSLHPLLAGELLRLISKVGNVKNPSQLLFTTHNPLLLDMSLLRRDQIWFADKNREGESFLYPLTDYKPRLDESLVRGYMAGRYGGIPFIPHGLIAECDLGKDSAEGKGAK